MGSRLEQCLHPACLCYLCLPTDCTAWPVVKLYLHTPLLESPDKGAWCSHLLSTLRLSLYRPKAAFNPGWPAEAGAVCCFPRPIKQSAGCLQTPAAVRERAEGSSPEPVHAAAGLTAADPEATSAKCLLQQDWAAADACPSDDFFIFGCLISRFLHCVQTLDR